MHGEVPEPGQLVWVRQRRWLVESVQGAEDAGSPVVRLACAEDDALGETLQIYWALEPDRAVLADEWWQQLGHRGFDEVRRFAAYLNALRWNTVTATDPELFQSPYRAGIHIDAYQMEPLRKALRLPRVNLFVADDTGLGKTIEAALILRELLLRRKVRFVVVAVPPSVLAQWRAELLERFGLRFETMDRAFVARVRRERGFGANPWRTHTRFLVSHRLLTDPAYAEPLRERLGSFLSQSLLVLDEAHHAAPASPGGLAIESRLTCAVRDLSGRFEHRLFLSATPHNGHSASFSALMEILDPHRFTRGVKVRSEDLKPVLVRRLKEDLRALQGGFPERRVVPIVVDDLPEDAPELRLSRLLAEYTEAWEGRLASAPRRTRDHARLLLVGLQQRLLSSIEAFYRSLRVHAKTAERAWSEALASAPDPGPLADGFTMPPGADDELADLSAEEAEQAEQAATEALTLSVAAAARPLAEQVERERRLLQEMLEVAEAHRFAPCAKVRRLLAWIREHLCPELPPFGQASGGPPPRWLERRVLVFTEHREGTKRYLHDVLRTAIAHTDRAEERIAVIDGLTSPQRRRELQRRFNAPPAEDPLRILIATDAAREGLNFQAHCADLFHFDLPWNPGRIEQRNGRIDRRLQPSPVVRCHYFVLPQRPEDHVLQVLVRKTETIRRELGSLATVIDGQVEHTLLRRGIRRGEAAELADTLERLRLDAERRQAAEAELEAARARRDALQTEIERCRRLLGKARKAIGYDEDAFREALCTALELLGARPMEPAGHYAPPRAQRGPGAPTGRIAIYRLVEPERLARRDPSWNGLLDTLRRPQRPGEPLAEWRRRAPVRPVVFRDPGVLTDEVVHLHLEHPLAQRLLARFRAQGFVDEELARACLLHTTDALPRVLLLGRLACYGAGAERLHEEIVAVGARWLAPERRGGPLAAYAEGQEAERRALELLWETLHAPSARMPSTTVRQRLLAAAPADVEALRPVLEARARKRAEQAERRLQQRAQAEAEALRGIIETQAGRIRTQIEQAESQQLALDLASTAERRERERTLRTWRERLRRFEHDLQAEPRRIAEFYRVRARRLEPVGLVYLWPESN